MKKISLLKSWTTAYSLADTAIEDLQVIFDFSKEGEASDQEVEEQYAEALKLVEDLELRNMLRKQEDQLGAILKINAGAEGTESND